MNYLDLFSGCGGFRLGLEKSGITPAHEFHSEIDKYADQVYCNHYPQSENLGDVTKITTDGTIQGHRIDLITFGFPCQNLSVAGKREGLKGSRSGLFYEATRLIKELKPEVFIFENVKGLFSSEGGADFTAVLREITDIGLYECQWQLLNTRWVLPQNRERIFFIGCLTGSKRSGRQIFPITESDQKHSRQSKHTQQRMGYSQCLTARGPQSRQNADYTWIAINDPNRYASKNQNGIGLSSKYQFTLTCQDRHGIWDKGKILRAMTPTEWERLQGFADNWTNAVSETQRYKMLGNAVTVDIAKMIFERIYIDILPIAKARGF